MIMTTTFDQIDLWLQEKSEHQNLEFKEARQNFAFEKLCSYSVAIANEGGGHLVFGVTDAAPRRVVGSNAFENVIDTADRLFRQIGFRVDLEVVMHPDGRILIAHIPSRARGSAYHLDGKYLMRSGESLTPMSEDRLRAIFAEGQPDWLEEHSLTGLTGQKVIELLDTQSFFDLMNQPYPVSQASVLSRLCEERLVEKVANNYSIRRLGGLLIAKRLDAFPDLVRKAPRVIVYSGNNKLETKLQQFGARGYAAGFQGLVDFVMGQLPQNEVLRNALRTEVKLLPEEPVRELIANSLVHQDMTVSGMSPVIEIYANRLEISNPGEPVVPVIRFIDGYQSRNERLADFMRRMKICEERSSGVDRVVSAAEMYQLPAPDFRTAYRRTEVTIFGPRDFEDMDKDDRIRACYQHCALKRVDKQYMTNQSLRARFGLGPAKQATVSQIIAATIDAGLVKLDEAGGESRRYARYLPFWA